MDHVEGASRDLDTRASRRDALRRGIGVVSRGWWIVVVFGVVAGVVALGVSLLQAPEYESTATLYVTSGLDANAQSAYQGSLASEQRVASYVELVKSDSVVDDALRRSDLPISASDARAQLIATATPQTVLMSISARSREPEEAALLANSVADAMTSYVKRLEQPSDGGAPLAKLTLVSPAVASGVPVSPNPGRNSALAVVFGMVVGLVFLILRYRFDSRLRTSDEVALLTDTPVLSEIPSDLEVRGGPIDFGVGASRSAESFRKLRTNLSFVKVDSPARKILVTSARASEGKTTSAVNLAAALAEAGNSVVLVDGDLRKPSVSDRLGVGSSAGLTDFIRGERQVTDLVQRTNVARLDVLASGQLPPNPAELLGSQVARHCLDELARLYDYVIVDSPPILPVTDAVISAQNVDGVLLVVRLDKTQRSDVLSAMDALRTARVEVLGAVANFASESFSYSRYSKYEGYGLKFADGAASAR